jgi:hypothetical protein
MKKIGNYILLSSITEQLGLSRQNINYHLKNRVFGNDCIKTGNNWFIPLSGVSDFLNWYSIHGRNVDTDIIDTLFKELNDFTAN